MLSQESTLSETMVGGRASSCSRNFLPEEMIHPAMPRIFLILLVVVSQLVWRTSQKLSMSTALSNIEGLFSMHNNHDPGAGERVPRTFGVAAFLAPVSMSKVRIPFTCQHSAARQVLIQSMAASNRTDSTVPVSSRRSGKNRIVLAIDTIMSSKGSKASRKQNIGSGPTKNRLSLNQTSVRATPLRRYRTAKQHKDWNAMMGQLQQFYAKHGHSNVPSNHEDVTLYEWTCSIRKNYKKAAHHSNTTTALPELTKANRATAIVSAGRPPLSSARLIQLQKVNFCWDRQSMAWEHRYQQLKAYKKEHGHTRVSPQDCQYPGLGVWVRNQRRARNACKSLTNNRLQRLLDLDFTWAKSHHDSWHSRYQQLVRYQERFGHNNVSPQDTNPAFAQLGTWCMNQRTLYRNYQLQQAKTHAPEGEQTVAFRNDASSSQLQSPLVMITPERIDLLNEIHFCWNVHDSRWLSMFQRLRSYQQAHGHINIPASDGRNRDLRIWLIRQRFYYNQRYKSTSPPETAEESSSGVQSGPLTPTRIQIMEEGIPDFQWSGRPGKNGPSSKDWTKLFNAMRDIGIRPGLRPRPRWLKANNPSQLHSTAAKDFWSEEDLLELWNQESEEDEESGHGDVGSSTGETVKA
jgi:Helicase associated domain